MNRQSRDKPPDTPWRPNRAELEAARKRTVPDVIDRGLDVLFVGINPGLYSAAIGHHFGRPGNRFWPALFAGGFTPRLLSPFEEVLLLEYGLGMTNLVDRATATADELSREELQQGANRLLRKVRRFRPRFVAPLGLTSFRSAFGRPKAILGRQPDLLAEAPVWLLPNPSGLNAHHQPKDLARMFREFYGVVHGK
ncbi:MAG TPA: G/U mismatch-specific DNA glycosylase [Pirellulales bacterium]